MFSLAVVAPAAPAIPWAVLGLGSALVFVVSWGLLHGWGRSFGMLFQWLGNKGIDISIRAAPDIHIHPFRVLLSIDQSVRHGLSVAVAASEYAMSYSFHRVIGIVIWAAQETAGLATDVYEAIRGAKSTVTTTITKVLDAKTQALVRKLTVAIDTVTHVTIPGLRARVKALEHRAVKVVHATAGAIASPFPRIGRLEKTAKAQGKRLTKIEKALAAGVGAALLVRTLAKLGLGWLRCGNVTKTGKRLCSLDGGLLDALLIGTTLLVGTISLREFAEEVGSVTEEVSGLIHGFIRDA